MTRDDATRLRAAVAQLVTLAHDEPATVAADLYAAAAALQRAIATALPPLVVGRTYYVREYPTGRLMPCVLQQLTGYTVVLSTTDDPATTWRSTTDALLAEAPAPPVPQTNRRE